MQRAVAALAFLAAWAGAMGFASAQTTPVQVRAVRGTPVVDGSLAEEAWSAAPWVGPFVQREPAFGAKGTRRTRTRVTYDDHAMYVAVECETDETPDARLGRRDQIPTGEAVRVLVDAHGDGNGAMVFSTNPSGMQADSIIASDGVADPGWDAVWDVETSVSDKGWVAEFRIPWSVLRFEARAPDVKLQVERDDFQAGEVTALVGIPPNSPKFVARFAPIKGVEGLRPSRVFELRPYTLGRWRGLKDPDRLDPTPTWSGSIGGDLKLGLTNDLMLDASINPDFGQVEVDPAVLNLSPFEPFFPEKRPFFLEGSDIFKTPLRIVHTRRIGQTVQSPDPIHPGGEMSAVDPSVTIYGATKLTGRIGGVSVGLLEGVTGPAHATERYTDASGGQHEDRRRVIPVTNWTAARVRTSVGNGSTVGALATHVGRFGNPADAVGSVDWDMRLGSGVHRFIGQLAASNAWNATDAEHTGTAAHVQLSRAEDPLWIWDLRLRAMSRRFDPNGLGYLDRADLVNVVYDTYLRTPKPLGPLRKVSINPWVSHQRNMDGLLLDQHLGFDAWLTTRELWSWGAGGRYLSSRYDDRETRGGPAFHLGPSLEGWTWLDTDNRVRVRGGVSGSLATQDGGHRTNASGWLTWTVTPRISLSLTSLLRLVFDQPRWADTETDASGLDHYVFGKQQARIVDTTLRAGLSLSRRATLDLYSQMLVGEVRFREYTELARPDELVPYRPSADKSYQRLAVTVNAVGRYEYLPGSFVTLVLLQRQAFSPLRGEPGYGSTTDLLREARPDTMLMTKVSYLFL